MIAKFVDTTQKYTMQQTGLYKTLTKSKKLLELEEQKKEKIRKEGGSIYGAPSPNHLEPRHAFKHIYDHWIILDQN